MRPKTTPNNLNITQLNQIFCPDTKRPSTRKEIPKHEFIEQANRRDCTFNNNFVYRISDDDNKWVIIGELNEDLIVLESKVNKEMRIYVPKNSLELNVEDYEKRTFDNEEYMKYIGNSSNERHKIKMNKLNKKYTEDEMLNEQFAETSFRETTDTASQTSNQVVQEVQENSDMKIEDILCKEIASMTIVNNKTKEALILKNKQCQHLANVLNEDRDSMRKLERFIVEQIGECSKETNFEICSKLCRMYLTRSDDSIRAIREIECVYPEFFTKSFRFWTQLGFDTAILPLKIDRTIDLVIQVSYVDILD